MPTNVNNNDHSNKPKKNNNDGHTPIIRRRPSGSLRRRDGLMRYAADVTSQSGEDGILARLFDLLLLSSQEEKERTHWCVDVGAWDGQHLSNTYSLLVPSSASPSPPPQQNHQPRHQWQGILIEADTERFQQLEALHQPLDNICINVAVSVEHYDKTNSNNNDNDEETASTRSSNNNNNSNKSNLVNILLSHEKIVARDGLDLLSSCCEQEEDGDMEAAPSSGSVFDLLSIDIDGGDYWVLHDILTYSSHTAGKEKEVKTKKCFRPRVIVVEFNPTMPNDLIYIPARSDDDTMRHGASLAALVELAQAHDYTLVETTLYNAIFVPNALYQKHLQKEEVPDTSIEALHEPTMTTSLYQLYNGTLKLWGCKRMLWHRIPIDERKIQMLPPEERNFPFAPSAADLKANGGTTNFDTSRAVDLSPFLDESSSTTTDDDDGNNLRSQRAQLLWQQLSQDGFAYVRGLQGSGLSRQLAQQALQVTHEYLQTANEQVRRSCLTKDRARRGYSPMCTENFASLIGEAGPNDLVRKFRIGHERGDRDGSSGDTNNTNSALWQPNVWPSAETWDQADFFRETVEAYFATMTQAAQAIVQAICKALLAQDADLATALEPLLESKNNNNTNTVSHTSILTLLGYRTGTRHKGKNKGPLVAPHTDVGVVTILLFDSGNCAALQRSDGTSDSNDDDGGWIDVDLPPSVPEDPIFVVNVADCLSELTGGKLPSTLHRVVARPGNSPRNCCALFVGLDPNQVLQIGGESVTYEEWRKRRIARAQKVLKGNNASV